MKNGARASDYTYAFGGLVVCAFDRYGPILRIGRDAQITGAQFSTGVLNPQLHCKRRVMGRKGPISTLVGTVHSPLKLGTA